MALSLRGSHDAKIQIIEFADYECSYCQQTYPILKKIGNEFGGKVALACLGLTDTPGFFVNGHFLSGVVKYETLRDLIEQELTSATHTQ